MSTELPHVRSDSAVVRRHRAHQGTWRDEIGWPAGPPSDERARSRYPVLANYFAEEHEGLTPEQAGVNLIPPSAAEYAHQRLAQLRAIDGVAEPDRLWRNLLSSQPLAFSIAGHLRSHQQAAARLFARLTGREVVGFGALQDPTAPTHTLAGIEAEWFPPRQHHTGDRSGFDIAALLELADGSHMLLTIEVKYVDTFSPKKLDTGRYADSLRDCEITDQQADALVKAGGSQFLRSVLLTSSVLRRGIAGETSPRIDSAMAVVLGRGDDQSAQAVVERFARVDLPVTTNYWSHEDFCDAASRDDELADWADQLLKRYCPGASPRDHR
ncbi:PGN_0703 family putative restriction endonuclease [Nocardia sp. N13]|uniref:PGN_0703 family putative restriction endonuclease n=1 Tax=Nocardioides sp. N13(2025) TaxID=3453405 RepID=UPI003F76B0DB